MGPAVKSVITGIGWVTEKGIGRGRDYTSPPGGQGTIPWPSRKTAFRRDFPRFGRLDPYSKIGVTAIGLALRDANRDLWKEKRNVGLIGSSLSGCLSTDLGYFSTVLPEGGRLASPNLFAYTLPNSFLGEAAVHFGLIGTSYAICEQPLTGLQGLRFAIESIAEGESEGVLAGTCELNAPEAYPDLPVPPVTGALFCLLERADAPGASPYGPIEPDREGGIRIDGESIKDMLGLIRRLLKTECARKGFE
jgi:3-oxoacyl-[acyl-carrier-protein] synthase II